MTTLIVIAGVGIGGMALMTWIIISVQDEDAEGDKENEMDFEHQTHCECVEGLRKLNSDLNKSAMAIENGAPPQIKELKGLVHQLAHALEDAKAETIDNYEAEKLLAKGEFYGDINDALHDYYEWFKVRHPLKEKKPTDAGTNKCPVCGSREQQCACR